MPPHNFRVAIVNKSTNNKCWRGCGGKGTLMHCWWECRWVQTLQRTVWGFLKKLKMDLPYDLVIPLLGIYLKEAETLIWKNLSTPMFIAALFTKSQDLEAAQVPISRWVDSKSVVHLHNEILLGHKKEGNHTISDSMDGTGDYYAKWNKPVRERQITYLCVKPNKRNKLTNETETEA